MTVFTAELLVFCLVGMANAALTTIGTAQFDGSGPAYNLVWDDDNNGNSVVWLDYTNTPETWGNQNAWAAGLNLTYNIDSAYNISWDDSAWRLPSTVDGNNIYGYDGTTPMGFNITTSEMGHLFYYELGNLGQYDTSGNYQAGSGLRNTGDFENLMASWFWSGTENGFYPGYSWKFKIGQGAQSIQVSDTYFANGIAIRTAQVTTAVPLPCAALLLGSGLAGLLGLRRKKQM